ncbi:MAG: geranylgeranyl reductase family protein [Thermoplasmatota archaeon]
MLEYDAVVVGAGPIGGYVARQIAEKNYKVIVFEKNKKIGIPVNCAGLVSPRVFDFLDIQKEKVIQNTLKGANIHSPSGDVLTIGGNKVHAYAIDRTKFDNEIIKKSKKKGAEVHLESNVLSAQRNGQYIEITTSKKHEVKTKLVIGADGPYSKIRDRFLLYEPIEFLRGIGAEITNTNLNPDFVEIFVGEKIAPGFFAWIIPTNKNGTKARIGLCISQNIKESPKFYFQNFLKNKNSKQLLKDIKIVKYIGGIIPLGLLKKTYTSNVLVVGDAAAQVKPTSGGGIYTGLLSANHCSKVAIEALEKKIFSSFFLKKYQKLWYADIGKELFLGMKFRRIFKNLTDNQMDKYIKKFKNPKISEIISKYGDIDYPSKLVTPLLKKSPTLIRLIPSIIKEK